MSPTPSHGYSGTPLAKKLGLKDGARVCPVGAPGDYKAMVGAGSTSCVLQVTPDDTTDIVHLFVRERRDLVKRLGVLRKTLKDDASLWVSWPKKASKVPTTITEDVIREAALKLGFVDVKVCAVDEIWSGLKLVVRKELRAGAREH